MRKMFSYVLFGKSTKFWNGIPFTLLINSEVYPDFEMKFFVDKQNLDMPQFGLLEKVSKQFPSVHIEIMDESSQNLKLTIWRMKSLWEDSVDYMFCRDMDYAVSILARKSVEYFLQQSSCIIHGMRSYCLHSTPLMAGMCGFEVRSVLKRISFLAETFEDYLSFGKANVEYCKDWRWGCDQALLRDFFRVAQLYPFILDCFQCDAPLKINNFNGKRCPEAIYSLIELSNCNMEVLGLSDSFTKYTGKTFACTYTQVNDIAELCKSEMSKFVKSLL